MSRSSSYTNLSAHIGDWTNATLLQRTTALIRRIIEAPDMDAPPPAVQSAAN